MGSSHSACADRKPRLSSGPDFCFQKVTNYISLHVSVIVNQNDPTISSSHVCLHVSACVRQNDPTISWGPLLWPNYFFFHHARWRFCSWRFCSYSTEPAGERKCPPLRLEGEELSPISFQGTSKQSLAPSLGGYSYASHQHSILSLWSLQKLSNSLSALPSPGFPSCRAFTGYEISLAVNSPNKQHGT